MQPRPQVSRFRAVSRLLSVGSEGLAQVAPSQVTRRDTDWRYDEQHRSTMMKPWMMFAWVAACALAATVDVTTQAGDPAVLLRHVDHLVYATPDLSEGVARAEALLGVRATPGGQHPGEGTRNALIALGPTSYLEILGPDPEQPKPAQPRRFGIDDLKAPRLVTWAAKGSNLGPMVDEARRHGVMLGDVIPGSRRTPAGVLLSWHVTNQRAVIADGLVPFFIDWGDTPHPASSAATGASLIALHATHPDPAAVRRMLNQLGLDMPVTKADRPALVATIMGRRGRVELQ